VLVVDDEANVRSALVELLSDCGYDAASAGSTEEALACLDSFGPDVIVTDVRMAGRSGLELAEAVRDRPRPRIAFMSAFPPPRLSSRPWLRKPLDLDAFFDTVERLAGEPRP
jgi:CheY-like chemotaxis protein